MVVNAPIIVQDIFNTECIKSIWDALIIYDDQEYM